MASATTNRLHCMLDPASAVCAVACSFCARLQSLCDILFAGIPATDCGDPVLFLATESEVALPPGCKLQSTLGSVCYKDQAAPLTSEHRKNTTTSPDWLCVSPCSGCDGSALVNVGVCMM